MPDTGIDTMVVSIVSLYCVAPVYSMDSDEQIISLFQMNKQKTKIMFEKLVAYISNPDDENIL